MPTGPAAMRCPQRQWKGTSIAAYLTSGPVRRPDTIEDSSRFTDRYGVGIRVRIVIGQLPLGAAGGTPAVQGGRAPIR
jgi:hypothetical protein